MRSTVKIFKNGKIINENIPKKPARSVNKVVEKSDWFTMLTVSVKDGHSTERKFSPTIYTNIARLGTFIELCYKQALFKDPL